MTEHVFKKFDDELNKLRYRLVKMGTLVQQQLECAVKALSENDNHNAELALEIEQKIDKLDIKIDKQCLKIFALHQPVAMDLRLVLSAVSINDNMELIGDLTSDIAESIMQMLAPPGLIQKTKLLEMGKSVENIITSLMDSFVNMNIDLAYETIKLDTNLTDLFKENFILITDLMKNDNKLIDSCSYLLDINRNFWGISRQARSIAQELVFLFVAKLIKHQNIDDEILNKPDDEFGNEE
jgi:phosphate transport system protein